MHSYEIIDDYNDDDDVDDGDYDNDYDNDYIYMWLDWRNVLSYTHMYNFVDLRYMKSSMQNEIYRNSKDDKEVWILYLPQEWHLSMIPSWSCELLK